MREDTGHLLETDRKRLISVRIFDLTDAVRLYSHKLDGAATRPGKIPDWNLAPAHIETSRA